MPFLVPLSLRSQIVRYVLEEWIQIHQTCFRTYWNCTHGQTKRTIDGHDFGISVNSGGSVAVSNGQNYLRQCESSSIKVDKATK